MIGPYNLSESIYWLKKYFSSPSKKNPLDLSFPNSSVKFQDIIPCFDIVFLGDLMKLSSHQLKIGPQLLKWIDKADYLVANLETPLVTQPLDTHLKQYNHPRVLETLAGIKKPSQIYLSLANNHGNDFGTAGLQFTMDKINQSGMNFFGTKENPSVTLADKILIYASTQWSNSSSPDLSMFNKDHLVSSTSFDLKFLFPHWGHEFELYPRPPQVALANSLLQSWDAIIGHHSHCPQPISIIKEKRSGLESLNTNHITTPSKLVAYSLGNFAIAHKKDILNYGLTLKLSIGMIPPNSHSLHTPSPSFQPSEFMTSSKPSVTSPLVIGGFSWSFLQIEPQTSQVVHVELCDECPFFPEYSLPSKLFQVSL